MPAEEPAFRTIAIAGLGLIGGSIALKVRDRWPSIRIVGIDRPAVLAHALGSGAIERGAESIDEIGSPDLIVLAAPVSQNIELLRSLASRGGDHLASLGGDHLAPLGGDHLAPLGGDPKGSPLRGSPLAAPLPKSPLRNTIVTDVGGTKRDIVEAARALNAPFAFVGGHPIGGAERGGFGFARPDLFAGRPWIFTPDESTRPDVMTKLEGFVASLGARPATLSAAEHDRLMAYVSHLPQLTASALMAVVGVGASGGLKLAGRGLVDTTRLASSPASVWRDVSASNNDFLAEALDTLIATLTNLRRDLKSGEALEETFRTAGQFRAELMKGRD